LSAFDEDFDNFTCCDFMLRYFKQIIFGREKHHFECVLLPALATSQCSAVE